MTKLSLKTVIEDANSRQMAHKRAQAKGMTLMEAAHENGWKGTVDEFIEVLVQHGSLFDENFSSQLPALQEHLAVRDAESLMVMTEVVNAHLEELERELVAGGVELPTMAEVEAEPAPEAVAIGELETRVFAPEESPALEAPSITGDPELDAILAQAEQLIPHGDDPLAGLLGGDEEVSLAEDATLSVPEEASPEEGTDEVAVAEELLPESEAEPEMAPEADLMPSIEPEAGFEVAGGEIDEMLAMLEEAVPGMGEEMPAVDLPGAGAAEEPTGLEEEHVESAETEAPPPVESDELETEEMAELIEEEALPDYLASYLEEAPEAEVAPEAEATAGDDDLDALLSVALEEDGEGEESADSLFNELLDEGAAEVAVGALSEAEEPSIEELESALDSLEEPAVAEPAQAVAEESAEEIAEEPAEELMAELEMSGFAEVASDEEVAGESPDASVPGIEPAVEMDLAEEEMAEEEQVEEVAEELEEVAGEVEPQPGESTSRIVSETFVVTFNGEEIYWGEDQAEAKEALTRAFLQHGGEGLVLKRVVEREVVQVFSEEEEIPFSVNISIG